MKKLFLVIIAIELAAIIAAVEFYGSEALPRLERIASELEYLSDHE